MLNATEAIKKSIEGRLRSMPESLAARAGTTRTDASLRSISFRFIPLGFPILDGLSAAVGSAAINPVVSVSARPGLGDARSGTLTSARPADQTTLPDEIDHIELTMPLARIAGDPARSNGLWGYDAVHLAAALSVSDSDVVMATGNHDLADAAHAHGLSVARTS